MRKDFTCMPINILTFWVNGLMIRVPGLNRPETCKKEEPFHDVLCNVLSLLLFHVRISGRAFCSRVCSAHARTAALNRFSAQRKLHLPGSFL